MHARIGEISLHGSSTSINLTDFFNSLRPMPMKYPSPPLLPGPHKIKNSDVG